VTLDIDATEAVANKVDAHWTCNKCKGYMPMVGHIAETGQIVSCYFRQGNAAPAKENFEHWYNQRAEDSENRIKELKLDFGGDTLPCSDFNANALYFRIAALSYHLFALMRQLLPKI
jgi:predicted adenine nucleotide alpha hydrolase (AANH) superfamily ATPase